MAGEKLERILMGLTRAALWSEEPSTEGLPLTEEEWVEMYRLAHKQTVQGIVYDAICHLPEEFLPSGRIFSLWMPEMEALEANYQRHIRTIGWLTSRMTEGSQLRPIILKGIPLASLYPVPEHRVLGDIDVFYGNPTNTSVADDLIESWGFPIQRGLNSESCYQINDVVIEHHGLITISHVPWRKHPQKWLEEQLASKNGTTIVDLEGIHIHVLSPILDILQLSLHNLHHVVNEGIGLRQMCDFALYLNKNGATISAEELRKALDIYHIRPWTELCLSYCLRHLGLSKECLPYPIYIEEKDTEMLHQDILQTGNFGIMDDRNNNRPYEGMSSRVFTFRRILRNLRHYFKFFPTEAICWIISLTAQRFTESLQGDQK